MLKNNPGRLNFNYYRNLPNRQLGPVAEFNKLHRDSMRQQLLMARNKLRYTRSPHQRYNIWDILADNADKFIPNNLFLSQIDQIYLYKLLRELKSLEYINPGLELYCLRQIVKLP